MTAIDLPDVGPRDRWGDKLNTAISTVASDVATETAARAAADTAEATARAAAVAAAQAAAIAAAATDATTKVAAEATARAAADTAEATARAAAVAAEAAARATAVTAEVTRANGAYQPLAAGGLIAWGDSLPTGASSAVDNIQGNSYVTAAALLSGGKLRVVRNAGVPGNTSAQALARFSTDVLPYMTPGCVVVIQIGTNDALTSVSTATYVANLTAMVNAVRSANGSAVLVTLPPNSSDATTRNRLAVDTFNRAITRLAFKRGLPCLDVYGISVDPTSATQGWLAGLSADGTHPSAVTAKVWGQALADLLASAQPFPKPYLVQSNFDQTNLLTNGLFTTLSGGAGSTPSTWTRYNVGGPPTVTEATEADAANVLGNWFRVDVTAAAGQRVLEQQRASGYSVGDLIAVSGKIALSSASEGTFKATARVKCNGASGSPANVTSWVLTANVTPSGLFYGEAIVPAGTTALIAQLIVESAVGTAKVGQFSMANLTTLGLAGIA